MRYGCWAEFVYISESSLTHKPDTYTFSQAASLPMQALVAYGAVKAAGFCNKPVLDNIKHKDAVAEDIETVVDSENKALITKEGTDLELVNKAKVAVVGASSTTGLMVVDMLVSRGLAVVGVSSASSAATVISNGAVAVLDRNAGGLASKPPSLCLDVVIDCVGGQAIEDAARQALGNKGHFVTIMGPGSGAFGDGGDGAKEQMVQGMKIASRSFKGMFSSMKYTQAAMPMTGGPKIIEQLMNEGLKTVVDSEVEMFDQDSMISAVEKVNNHKTRGRLVFINDSN